MAKTKKQKETDGAYLLKLVLYVIVGAQWLFIKNKSGGQIPIPFGVFIGAVFASHEHFQIDRKVEYAVLLVAMFVGFFSQVGLFYSL
ncbi:MAG TPA: hypothetical protein VFI84_03005 [Candidatus Saccharimonadales bacterium]|nr:hypothetical protein [Candidatus Saccharimonadales bacterium]